MAKNTDRFSQIGYLDVTESAANTLTFSGLSVFSNVLGQKGMILQRAEYLITDPSIVVADADGVYFGLAGADSITSPSLDDPEIYDYQYFNIQAVGTPASFQFWVQPHVVDWTALPGGGLLVPADRLYVWLQGVNLGSALTLTCRFHYTIIDLSAQEYLELAQSLRVLK